MNLDNLAPQKRVAGREPLRTLKEFCEEFDVTIDRLRYLLKTHGGPKPLITRAIHRSKCAPSYYSPSEMRAWWRGLKEAA